MSLLLTLNFLDALASLQMALDCSCSISSLPPSMVLYVCQHPTRSPIYLLKTILNVFQCLSVSINSFDTKNKIASLLNKMPNDYLTLKVCHLNCLLDIYISEELANKERIKIFTPPKNLIVNTTLLYNNTSF